MFTIKHQNAPDAFENEPHIIFEDNIKDFSDIDEKDIFSAPLPPLYTWKKQAAQQISEFSNLLTLLQEEGSKFPTFAIIKLNRLQKYKEIIEKRIQEFEQIRNKPKAVLTSVNQTQSTALEVEIISSKNNSPEEKYESELFLGEFFSSQFRKITEKKPPTHENIPKQTTQMLPPITQALPAYKTIHSLDEQIALMKANYHQLLQQLKNTEDCHSVNQECNAIKEELIKLSRIKQKINIENERRQEHRCEKERQKTIKNGEKRLLNVLNTVVKFLFDTPNFCLELKSDMEKSEFICIINPSLTISNKQLKQLSFKKNQTVNLVIDANNTLLCSIQKILFPNAQIGVYPITKKHVVRNKKNKEITTKYSISKQRIQVNFGAEEITTIIKAYNLMGQQSKEELFLYLLNERGERNTLENKINVIAKKLTDINPEPFTVSSYTIHEKFVLAYYENVMELFELFLRCNGLKEPIEVYIARERKKLPIIQQHVFLALEMLGFQSNSEKNFISWFPFYYAPCGLFGLEITDTHIFNINNYYEHVNSKAFNAFLQKNPTASIEEKIDLLKAICQENMIDAKNNEQQRFILKI